METEKAIDLVIVVVSVTMVVTIHQITYYWLRRQKMSKVEKDLKNGYREIKLK